MQVKIFNTFSRIYSVILKSIKENEFYEKAADFVKKYLPYFKSKVVYGLLIFLAVVIIADFLFPLPKEKFYSKVIYAQDGSLLSAYLSKDDKWRMKTHLSEVSPELIKAILNKEDSWFYWHPGVNPIAIFRALIQNITGGKRVSGASTITMQVVRMLYPEERTYGNKIKEMLRALQLELHYSKQEILEMYLSMLPYGGNVEGVKAASYIYFNRPPSRLSLAQSILMAVIPNDPNGMRIDKDNSFAMNARNRWINKFTDQKVFPISDLKDAMNEPVSIGRYQIKNEAPHFSLYVAQRYKDDEIRTSLVPSIQKTAEKLLLNYVNRVRNKLVSNGAVIVIDNRTHSVAAYCGSADFNDPVSQGQVNGIEALRSPGSTLKPALYTLAFDWGMLTPEMKVLDVPTSISGYEPENYDLKFNGQVSVKFALVNSLNIPAVRLLHQIELGKFVELLIKGGFSDMPEQRKSIGLSMILGGCSVKLVQLARFFSVFASEGNLYPLKYLYDEENKNEGAVRLFSPASVYMTSQILSSNERPDYPAEFLSTTDLPKIAWKTGTSFGKRDAWAVGFNPNYTIGVWMGNFDGKGSPELSGAEMAVPLLFELFNSIDYKPKKEWFDRPKEVLTRDVCSETGLLPGDNCNSVIQDLYIEKVSPNKKCDLYKSVYVSNDETIQYCTVCLPDSGYKKVLYPNYDEELTLWMLKNKVPFKRPPPHNPYCQAKFSGPGPKIISPSADFEYYIEDGSKQQILLQAAVSPDVEKYYWYINDSYYSEAKPGEKIFFTPQKGILKITCLDNLGRKTTIQTKVEFY